MSLQGEDADRQTDRQTDSFYMVDNMILHAKICNLDFCALSVSVYVTGFGKTCIVHTSDFAHLEMHKNYREWYTDVKLSESIKE